MSSGQKGVPPILKLRAFGLVVRGDLTYYQIAEVIGIAAVNPSTAASRARNAAIGGWEMVRARRLHRWNRLQSWRVVGAPHFGARLHTFPPDPPPPPPTPLSQLLDRLSDLQQFANANGFRDVAMALKNMRAAVVYHESECSKKKVVTT